MNGDPSDEIQRFEGSLRMPGVGFLRVTPDALGETFEGTLSPGTFIRVTLPLPPDTASEPGAAHLLRTPRPDRPQAVDPLWGSITRTHYHGGVRAAFLELRVGGESDVDSDERLTAQLDRWVTTMVRWIELWTGQLVEEDQNRGLEAEYDLSEPGSGSPGLTSLWAHTRLPEVPGPDAVASPDQLRAAFAKASVGEEVPPEWLSLTNARRYENKRLAVIEAATAAEVAMAGAVKRLLAPDLTSEAIERIIFTANGAVGLLTLLKALQGRAGNAVSQERVQNKLAQPRNRAVHSGNAPTAEQVGDAIDTAHALLRDYSPLPGW